MKRILFYLWFLLVFNCSYSQQYIPLVVENATWIMASNTDVYAETVDYYAYKIKGDTTLNETTYKKLFFYELTSIGGGKYKIHREQFKLLLRENVAEKIVYGYPYLDVFGDTLSEEFILLDFSKSVGDTISYLEYQDTIFTTIIKESISPWFGEDRRTLHTANSLILIEGVGYYSGLLETPSGISFPTGDKPVVIDHCIGSNLSCNLLTATVEFPNSFVLDIEVYPNLARDFIEITTNHPFAQLSIISITGVPFLKKNFTSSVYIGDLPQGIFVLILKDRKGKTYAETFLKK